MEVVTREIVYSSRKEEFKVSFLGDVHLGGRDCDIDLFKGCIDKIASEPNHYWFGIGDWAEYINYTDKRFDPAELDPRLFQLKDLQDLAKVQCDVAAKMLKPIGLKCLGLIVGNHEEKIRLKYSQHIQEVLCHLLPSKYKDLDLGYCAIAKVRLKRISGKTENFKTVKFCLHHGAGGGGMDGASVNKIEKFASFFPYCDIYAYGHVHKRKAWIDPVWDCSSKEDKAVQRQRGYALTGTFKKTYEQGTMTYGEKAQYKPASLGCVSFIIEGENDAGENNLTAITRGDGLPA